MNLSDPLDALVLNLRNVPSPALTYPERPRRSLTPAVPIAIAATVAAGAVVFRPSPAYASGLSEAVGRSLQAQYRRMTFIAPDGEILDERWVAPGKFAAWHRDGWKPKGQREISFELRDDGRRVYVFRQQLPLGAAGAPSANVLVAGQVWTKRSSRRSFLAELPGPHLESFAESRGADVKEVREKGEIWYRVRARKAVMVHEKGTARYRHETYLVRLDEARRIAETKTEDGYRTLYRYPATIADAVFAPRPQVRPVAVLDLDHARSVAEKRLKGGLGEQEGVTLRLVALDSTGTLWVFWTGVRPNFLRGQLARLKNEPNAPSRLFPHVPKGVRKATEEPLWGHTLLPKRPLGKRVDLSLPGTRRRVTFRSVPVLRILERGDIADFVGLEK